MTGNQTGVGKGKTQLFAVEKHGVEEDVLKMYKEHIPATTISKILKEKGITITADGINRWLGKLRKADTHSTQIQSAEKFEAVVLDYNNEIISILEEVKEMKEIAKADKNLRDYGVLIGKLYQGMELLAKLMGDIKPKGSVDINIIINELNKLSFDENKDARQDLFRSPIIEIDAEILNDDKECEEKLNGERK